MISPYENGHNQTSRNKTIVLYRDASQTRTRYLNRLGIYQNVNPTDGTTNCPRKRVDRYNRHDDPPQHIGDNNGSTVPSLVSTKVTSKYQPMKNSSSMSSPKKLIYPLHALHGKNKLVRFQSHNSIRTIPARTEYSESIKQAIWSTIDEIQENFIRNSIEFIADGCDWRRATEEDDMFVDILTGELMHPIHHDKVVYGNVGDQRGVETKKTTKTATPTTQKITTTAAVNTLEKNQNDATTSKVAPAINTSNRSDKDMKLRRRRRRSRNSDATKSRNSPLRKTIVGASLTRFSDS